MITLFLVASALARPVDVTPVFPSGMELLVTEVMTSATELDDERVVTHTTLVTERSIERGGRLFSDKLAWTDHVLRVDVYQEIDGETQSWTSASGRPAEPEWWDLAELVGLTYGVTVDKYGNVEVVLHDALVLDDLEAAATRRVFRQQVEDKITQEIRADLAATPTAKLALQKTATTEGIAPQGIAQDADLARTWTLSDVDDTTAVLTEQVTLAHNPGGEGQVCALAGRGELHFDLERRIPLSQTTEYRLQVRERGERRTIHSTSTTTFEVK